MTALTWQQRFASFVAEKTQAAVAAVAPPYITVVESPRSPLIPVQTPWTTARFGGPFYVTESTSLTRPVCSLVFVQSIDGNTVTSDPSSLGGGQTDQHVVYEGLSRVIADAVLIGARTLYGGHSIFSVWHPELVALRQSRHLPRHPIQMVATLHGIDLEHGLLFNLPEITVIILTVATGATAMQRSLAARPWIRVQVMRDPGDLTAAFTRLRDDGIRRISCVGGRVLAAELLERKLIDDVYLTTSTRHAGEPDTALSPRARQGTIVVRKRGTDDESGVVFEHFHLDKTEPS